MKARIESSHAEPTGKNPASPDIKGDGQPAGSLLTQAISLYLGTKGRTDEIKARELFQQASEAGDPLATMWVARCHHKARCGFPKNESKARELARKVAKTVELRAREGIPTAMTLWASALDSGLGVTQQSEEAVAWYRRAAEAGDLLAMGNLGACFYERGDRPGAVVWHRKAAEAGLPSSMVQLGSFYGSGEGGVRRDEKEAIRWFLKAADAGNADAMLRIGLAYDDGIGVRQDPQEAVKWYRKGAESGNASCMNNLGECHEKGRGTPISFKDAVHWFQKAADADNRFAMFNLGHMYWWGQGVPADSDKAEEWMRKSADAGFEQAKTALREIRSKRNDDNVPRYTSGSRRRFGDSPSEQAIENARYQSERAMRDYQTQTAGNMGAMGLIYGPQNGQSSGYGTTYGPSPSANQPPIRPGGNMPSAAPPGSSPWGR